MCMYLCWKGRRGWGGGEGGSILIAELIPVLNILIVPEGQNLQAAIFFLSSRPVMFVDDQISVSLNQPAALLNLAWPITPAGNVAQSMLHITILVSMGSSCLWLCAGMLAVICSLAVSLQKDDLCGTVLYLLVYVRSLFLWVTVRCYQNFMDLCAAANTEGENPLCHLYTPLFQTWQWWKLLQSSTLRSPLLSGSLLSPFLCLILRELALKSKHLKAYC